MKQNRFTELLSVFALVAVLALTGCDPDRNDEPDVPPADAFPVVTLVSPSTGYALAKKGETVSMEFEIHDNELLAEWDATEKWIAVTGQTVLAETPINGEFSVLSSNSETRTINYMVPQGVQVYTTIEIRAKVKDNKGQSAMALFKINVIPEVDTTTAYEIQEYQGDTIWSITTGDNYNYDIINRMAGDDAEIAGPNRYLRESSMPPAIEYKLRSPIWNTTDSVLVTTNTGLFNFDELTYETMWEAYVTSNRIGDETDMLNVGDVVILKMPNLPHYAAFVIRERNPGGCGCLVFDYKYSYE